MTNPGFGTTTLELCNLLPTFLASFRVIFDTVYNVIPVETLEEQVAPVPALLSRGAIGRNAAAVRGLCGVA
jgi:hypothetical protein